MSNLTKAEFRNPGADQHCYIATPAHTIFANFHVSLIRTIPVLLEAGISVTYAHLAGHCHVDDARNLLVADFLKTKATHLLFWDADVAAEPGAALKLLRHDVDVVGGAYPLKDGSGKFPAKLKGGEMAKRGDLIAAYSLPTGFLCIRRHVIEQLAEGADQVAMDGVVAPIVFERSLSRMQGEQHWSRVGGDVQFCAKVGAGGLDAYCDPSLLFTHAGVVDFAGRLSDHMEAS